MLQALTKSARRAYHRIVFRCIYASNAWGDDDSRSGTGSSLQQTRTLRDVLPQILSELRAEVLVDVPCGDGCWISNSSLPIRRYIGLDLVPDVLNVAKKNLARLYGVSSEFHEFDVRFDKLPAGDVILCRDCLVHLPLQDALSAVKNIKRSESRYLLATSFPERSQNVDSWTGRWRPINLQAPPFNFPEPLKVLREDCTENDGEFADKCLCLWNVSEIPPL